VNGLPGAVIYSTLALGLAIFLGVLRVVNFAQGDFATLGGYAITVATTAGFSLYVGVLVGLVVGAAVGVAFYVLLISPLQKAPEINQLLATYGLAIFIQGLLQWKFTASPRVITLSGASLKIGPVYMSRATLIDVVMAATLVTLLFLVLERTQMGRAVRAVAQNPTGATLIGIDSRRVFLFVCGVAGALSTAAGYVLVTTFALTPTVGFEQILTSFTIVIVAGLGNLYRLLFLGFGLAFAQSWVTYLYNDTAALLAVYGLIVAMLLIRPTGLGSRAH
jgi:branched-chain amino acid transport system permease protein